MTTLPIIKIITIIINLSKFFVNTFCFAKKKKDFADFHKEFAQKC